MKETRWWFAAFSHPFQFSAAGKTISELSPHKRREQPLLQAACTWERVAWTGSRTFVRATLLWTGEDPGNREGGGVSFPRGPRHLTRAVPETPQRAFDIKRAVLSVSTPNSLLLQSGPFYWDMCVCWGREWLLWAAGSEEARLRLLLVFFFFFNKLSFPPISFPSKPLGNFEEQINQPSFRL